MSDHAIKRSAASLAEPASKRPKPEPGHEEQRSPTPETPTLPRVPFPAPELALSSLSFAADAADFRRSERAARDEADVFGAILNDDLPAAVHGLGDRTAHPLDLEDPPGLDLPVYRPRLADGHHAAPAAVRPEIPLAAGRELRGHPLLPSQFKMLWVLSEEENRNGIRGRELAAQAKLAPKTVRGNVVILRRLPMFGTGFMPHTKFGYTLGADFDEVRNALRFAGGERSQAKRPVEPAQQQVPQPSAVKSTPTEADLLLDFGDLPGAHAPVKDSAPAARIPGGESKSEPSLFDRARLAFPAPLAVSNDPTPVLPKTARLRGTELSPGEIALLAILSEAEADQPLAESIIAQRLGIMVRSLEPRMTGLRKKFGNGNTFIVTYRGVGYTLKDPSEVRSALRALPASGPQGSKVLGGITLTPLRFSVMRSLAQFPMSGFQGLEPLARQCGLDGHQVFGVLQFLMTRGSHRTSLLQPMPQTSARCALEPWAWADVAQATGVTEKDLTPGELQLLEKEILGAHLRNAMPDFA